MTTATDTIPAWVEPYIGIPWVDRGRTRAGSDCYGIVRLALFEQHGVELPSYDARYTSTKDRVAVARLFFQEATSPRWRRVQARPTIQMAEARPGDVLEISLAGERHCGLVVAPDRFLHVLAGRQTCVERVRPHWTHRIDAVYRHESLA